MPPGPAHYPIDSPSDMPEEPVAVAELAREQLSRFAVTTSCRISITTRRDPMGWPASRVETLVERVFEKGIAIGKKGAMLKLVGTAAAKLPPGAFLASSTSNSKRTGNAAAIPSTASALTALLPLCIITDVVYQYIANRTG